MPQNPAPFESSQRSTTLQPSHETVDSPFSGIGPTLATFTDSSDSQEANIDLFDTFTNFAHLENVEIGDQAQSSQIEEDKPAVLSL